jgi:hypothetical protein
MNNPVPAYNRASWKHVLEFYEKLIVPSRRNPSILAWSTHIPIMELVREILATDRASQFQAGTSVGNLFITTSTKSVRWGKHHSIGVQPAPGDNFLLTYYGKQQQRLYERICTSDELPTAVSQMLDEVWENRPGRRSNFLERGKVKREMIIVRLDH